MASASTSQRLPGTDERTNRRRTVVDSGLVTVEMYPAGFGLMLNVSDNGVCVYTLKKLTPSQEVQVSFLLPGVSKRIECRGEVKWAIDSHAGLHLRDFAPDGSAALSKWLASLPESPRVEHPRLQRRKFPLRDEQARSIEGHIATERLAVDAALQFVATRILDLTSANGSAIAVGERSNMVCRASAGLAPEIGVQIGSTSGLTGECIRTGKTIYCEDTELDSRVDRQACRELNLRSSLIVPVMHQEKVAGVLEAFSPAPSAFAEDQRWLLARLADLIARLVYRPDEIHPPKSEPVPASIPPVAAAKPANAKVKHPELPPQSAQPLPAPGHAAAEPMQTAVALLPEQDTDAPRVAATGKPKAIWIATVFALVIAILLMVELHHPSKPAPASSLKPPTIQRSSPSAPPPVAAEPQGEEKATPKPAVRKAEPAHIERPSASRVPLPPDIVILHPADSAPAATHTEAPPATAPTIQLAKNASMADMALPITTAVPELKKAVNLTGGQILHRVNPVYPPFALQHRIQGDVVLRAHVTTRGSVASVVQIKGDPILGKAAKDAVRHWRYEPFKLGANPEEMDVTITVQFRMPNR